MFENLYHYYDCHQFRPELKRRGNEKNPERTQARYFRSLQLMNHCEMNYISINDETCSCKYKLTHITSSSLDEILFTDRLK